MQRFRPVELRYPIKVVLAKCKQGAELPKQKQFKATGIGYDGTRKFDCYGLNKPSFDTIASVQTSCMLCSAPL